MDTVDRQLLHGLARMNQELGDTVVELLGTQAEDTTYAHALRTLGNQLITIGTRLAGRAAELDGGCTAGELLLQAPR